MAESLTSIPGVSSGIDWSSVVDAIITAEKRPATRLQATITANAKKKDALELFRQAMQSLQSAADGLRNGKALDAFSVSAVGADATGRGVLAATVGTGAVGGTYAVNVTSLAAAQKTVASTGWTGTQTLASGGTLTIGGKPVTLVAGEKLSEVRDRINAETARTGVQASLLSMNADGSDQRLVLTGQKTGLVNAFAVADDTNGALVAALGIGGAPAVPASDATFTLDGGATPITRPTNTITDAIPGVTMTLGAKGTSTVTVERQPNAGATTMQAFVDAYNKVQAFVKGQSVAGSPLQNDPLLRSVRGQLATLVLTPAARVDDSGVPTAVVDDMTSLGALGVSVQKDGTLTFDRAKFDAVYPSRMGDVRAVLSDRMSTAFHFADDITGTFTGEIDKREQGMQTQNATLQARIDEFDSRLAKKRTALLAKYARFEASLGTLKSLGEQMAAQFSGLNKSSDS
ncbi:flagellar filament capping protein FliD [Roseisolibacter agri]|uniref:Flagellar hook-associated protein 2 n=1 Tax=Roseisolibacter agri TaxID=2014610 RepID=A0AA37Q2T5_9BACT|nr:flagellar filament capping protein FliD [Roseisolibacter agri]GLC25344.1 flagellar hook-associated protein 2 [Roseisolibacter agri]